MCTQICVMSKTVKRNTREREEGGWLCTILTIRNAHSIIPYVLVLRKRSSISDYYIYSSKGDKFNRFFVVASCWPDDGYLTYRVPASQPVIYFLNIFMVFFEHIILGP